MSCNCGKPKPGPHGNSKPEQPTTSLTASVGGSGRFTHVAPNGKRTVFNDILGARAEAVRRGGSVEIA